MSLRGRRVQIAANTFWLSLVDDPGEVFEVVRTVTERHGGNMPASTTDAAVGPVAIALRPERVSSWDHRKLTGRC